MNLRFLRIDPTVIITSIVALLGFVGCNDNRGEQKVAPKPVGNSGATKGSAITGSKATQKPATQIRWAEHGADWGVDFTYQNGEAAWLVAMIESNGGGVGVIDYDNDGRWDLFIPGGGRLTQEKRPIMVNNGLFRQVDKASFQNKSLEASVQEGVCYSFGANVGDYDGDGFADVFITGFGGQQLLKNLGDGTFEDVTAVCGFQHTGWSSSAAWLDADNDGDLDLYVSHYGIWSPEIEKQCFNSEGEIDRCTPSDFVGEADELWLNESDGSFIDCSDRVACTPYRGVGVATCDFDMDGDTDIFVTNDGEPNNFFDNLGQAQFAEIGARSGTALGSRPIADGSMGIAIGDFDGNLKPDMLVTNYQNEYCELYLNQGKQYFTTGTRSAGLMALGQNVVGWGTAFLDADHDGDEDLIVIAGHTSRKPIRSSNLQKSYFLENTNRKRLASVGEECGEYFRTVHAGRGAAIGDLDNDGDVDCIVNMLEQPIQILENTSELQGNYLIVDLVGTQSNRDAVGAYVEIVLADHTRSIRHRTSGGSYASTHAGSLHFGLGKNDTVASLQVHWPSGQLQSLDSVSCNKRITIVEQAR